MLADPHQGGSDAPAIAAEKPVTTLGPSGQPTVRGGAGRGEENAQGRRAVRTFAVLAALLTGAFVVPLWDLLRFSVKSPLFSHVPLIPAISAWWIWKRPGGLEVPCARPTPGPAAVPAVAAGILLAGYWLVGGVSLPSAEYLGLVLSAYLLALLAAALATLGAGVVRAFRFPILFLLFMIPWPQLLVDALETALQYASAEAAYAMLVLSGVPVFRDGLVFKVPGLIFEVAQECSGIRSSLVLFITSVLGAHLLLRTSWRRWALVLAVLPLGVLRNGLRILTLALLCVHVDPAMIDSPLHHRGGPIFFMLSLGPFFLLLWWLRRGERKAGAAALVG